MMATLQQVDDFSMLKKHLKLPNLEEILLESKSLNILVLGDLQDSKVVDGLTGIKWSCSKEVNKSTITTDDGAEEIVVYRAMREGIDVTVWNAPSLSFHQEGYVQEIKRILETVDLKLLCIGKWLNEDFVITLFKGITSTLGVKFLNNSIVSDLLKSHDLRRILMRKIVQPRFSTSSTISSVDISTIFLKDTDDKIIVIHPEIPASYAHWQSRLFFDCVRHLCPQNAKGALLKLNLKRFKHIPEDEEVPSVPCPIEQQPLTFTFKERMFPIPDFLRPKSLRSGMRRSGMRRSGMLHSRIHMRSICCSTYEDDGLLLKRRILLPTEPPPPPEEAEDKSEPVQELTHFYTGTHDLQFGAHGGGAQATPSGEPPASNQE